MATDVKTLAGLIATESVKAVAKPMVLVAEKLGAAGIELLEKVAVVDRSYNLLNEDLCAKISHRYALIVRSGTKVTKEVSEASKGRLKVVGRAVVGIDNVDLQAATEVGCLVVNAPTANTVAAAERLGRLAVQLVSGGASVKQVKVVYRSALADDVDTRLLKVMITKGLIEPVSSAFINLVNADYVAKQRGLKISEERQPTDGAIEVPLESITVHSAIPDYGH